MFSFLFLVIVGASSAFQQSLIPISSSRIPFTTTSISYSIPVDVSENAQRDISQLIDWASNNCGIQVSDCYTLQSDDGGYNVYATTNQDLPVDSPIVCIPNNIILTGSKAREELGGDGAENTLQLSGHNTLYLFLKILKEWELGEQSIYYTWLNSLPRYYSNGSSMTDFCFGCLPPYAAELALAEKNRLAQFVQALTQVSVLSPDTKSNTDLAKWAINVVLTRMMMMPNGDYCIAPLADMFNHSGDISEVSISYDEDGNCYAYSTRNIQAGSPLRIRYDDPTNPSRLLAKYGFLDESSPATFCKYVISNPTEEVYSLGYPSSMVFYQDGSISDSVWDILLYDELTKVSPNDQQTFYQACMSGDDEATKQSYYNQYFAQTLATLKQHVDYIVNELDELSLGLETQMKQGEDAIRHPRLPLIISHNEFVSNTFEVVQANLDNMLSS